MRRVKRRSTLLVLVVVVLALIVAGVLYLLLGREEEPDKEPPGQDTAQLAAEEALKTLEKLVTAENYAAMGFASLAEVAQAQLGAPMTVYRVQLDHLREYTPGETDPVGLLVDVSRQLYPVTVGEEVRSSVAVEESRETWRGTDYGAPGLMKALSQYRQSDDDFAVHVGFLGLYFVGQRSEDGLWLTPLLDDPDLGFVAGEPLAVEEVFRALLPLAQEYKEEAPM